MTVPGFLIVISFVAMMVLGIYIVFQAVTHPFRKGTAKLTLFGSSLSLNGPSWLVMIVVGAGLVGTPVIAAALQQQAQTPFSPPAPVITMDRIDEPNYDSFRFSKDLIVLDLRQSQSGPWYVTLTNALGLAQQHSRIRPATVINELVLRKVVPADSLHVVYTTSGELDLRCITHSFTVRTSFDKDQDTRVGDLVIDVKSLPLNQDFTVINQVTYWNAFRGSRADNYSTYTHDQTESEDMRVSVLFPDAKPYQSVEVKERTERESTERPTSIGTPYVGPENRTFDWSASAAGKGKRYYILRWTW